MFPIKQDGIMTRSRKVFYMILLVILVVFGPLMLTYSHEASAQSIPTFQRTTYENTKNLKVLDWSLISSAYGASIAEVGTLCDTERGNLMYVVFYKDHSNINVVPNACPKRSH